MIMLIGALLWLTVAPAMAFGIEITSCGREVPRREVGELRADLQCGSDRGVFLGPRAMLNLNGFTIAGSSVNFGGVACSSRCTINGPGEIRGFAIGISGGSARLRVNDVALRFNTEAGVANKGGVMRLSNVVATDNGFGVAMAAGRLRGRDVETSNNRDAGVWTTATTTKLVRLRAVGNGRYGGVYLTSRGRYRTRIVNSTIVGNDGLGEGYDVLTTDRVKLVNSVCGRGARIRVSGSSPKVITVLRPLRGCRDD